MNTLPIYQTARPLPFYPDLLPALSCGGPVICTGEPRTLPSGTQVTISQISKSGRALLYAPATTAHDAGWAWAKQDDFTVGGAPC